MRIRVLTEPERSGISRFTMTNTTYTASPRFLAVADRRTAELTAFDTYAALTAACRTGYVPTLSPAASWLGFWLETDGHRVFWRS